MPEGDSDKNSGVHSPSRAGTRQSQPDLLLVEDVKVSQRIASVALQRVHFRVEVAASGEEAVAKYDKLAGSLNIILMDFGLPGMSGLEASRKIREMEREAKRKPVIIFGLTGSVIESDLPKFIEVGLNGCIAKGKLLGEAVQEALNRVDADPTAFVLMNEQADKVKTPKSTKIVAVKPAQLNPEVSSSQGGDLDGIIGNGGQSTFGSASSASASSSSPSSPSSSSSSSFSAGLGLGLPAGPREGMLGRSSLAMTLLNRKSTGVRPGVGLPSAEHRFASSTLATPACETDDEESESEFENDAQSALCCQPSFLPSSRAVNEDTASSASTASAASSASSSSDSESKDLGAYEGCDILLVEDVRVSQKIAQSAIQRCGFKVDVASDGETAVTKYTNNPNRYKVVLMDIGLPGISGSDAAQQIRAFEAEHKRQPAAILAMTGNVEEESVMGYEQIGMNGCIMKGKQVGASVMEALCSLNAQPNVFVNMCERKAGRK